MVDFAGLGIINGQPERSISGLVTTSGSIELTYFPWWCCALIIRIRYEQVTADHTPYRGRTECPFSVGQLHINDGLAVIEALLLTDRSVRQETDVVALVVLEAHLLNGVVGSRSGQVRQFRIRSAVGHGRDDDRCSG